MSDCECFIERLSNIDFFGFTWTLSRKWSCDFVDFCWYSTNYAVADQEILTREEAEDNVSASLSFIANAQNKIYAFYTKKTAYWKKM